MSIKPLEPYRYFRYDYEDYKNGSCLQHPLYAANSSVPRAAYIVIDMAWYDSYFVAGISDYTTLQEMDFNNRILQFEISPLITPGELERLSEDASFFSLVRRIYAGCVKKSDFKACFYNNDAREAITAVIALLKTIPVRQPPENPVEFYRGVVMKEQAEKFFTVPKLYQQKRKCNTDDYMSIIPENSHLLRAENLLCSHYGLYIWPVRHW